MNELTNNDTFLFLLVMSLVLAPLPISWWILKNSRFRNFYAFLTPFFIYPILFILVSIMISFGGFLVVPASLFGIVINTFIVAMYLFSTDKKNQ